MAQPRPPPGGPPGNQRNPYAQRLYYDSQSNGPEAQYPAMRSTTALIGAQESQTTLTQFPSYGVWPNDAHSPLAEWPLTGPRLQSEGPPGRPNVQPLNPFGQQYAQSTFSSTPSETTIHDSTFGVASKHPYPAWTNDKNVPLSMEEIEGTSALLL